MPNWAKLKKMAAAFGRAVEDPSATKGGRDIVFKSKTVQNAKDRAGDFTTRIEEKDTPAQKSFKAGRYQGQESWDLARDSKEWEDAKKIWDNYDPAYAKEVDPDAAYYEAMRGAGVSKADVPIGPEEFKERFNIDLNEKINGEDFPMAEEHVPGFQKNWERDASAYTDFSLDDDFDKAFTSNINRRKEKVRGSFGDESADMFEEQLWNVIDELKANGKSGNEILDMLRVDKPREPYGE